MLSLQARAGVRMQISSPVFRTSGNSAPLSPSTSKIIDDITAKTHGFQLYDWQKIAIVNMKAGRNIFITA